MADTAKSRKKLIEVSIPLEAINKEALRRKQKAPKGYPTAIHKYWAQRPIALCRAVLFAQLVDDPMPVRLSANGALNRRCVAMSCSRFCLGSI
jgi:adenine-specific DNA methylase